jgi:hypothetical protein
MYEPGARDRTKPATTLFAVSASRKVQHAALDHAGRDVQAEAGAADALVSEDRLRVTHVPLDRHDPGAARGQQRLRMGHRHRVVVDVGHQRIRDDGPGRLVGGQPQRCRTFPLDRGRGQPRADVQELPHALPGYVVDGPGLELLVVQGLVRDVGAALPDGLGRSRSASKLSLPPSQ